MDIQLHKIGLRFSTFSRMLSHTGKSISSFEFGKEPRFETPELLARIRTHIELKNAREEIKSLRGIIPICASCKKIRDDKGYWNQIEAYISEHSEADFSHGICPTVQRDFIRT